MVDDLLFKARMQFLANTLLTLGSNLIRSRKGLLKQLWGSFQFIWIVQPHFDRLPVKRAFPKEHIDAWEIYE